MSEKNDSSAGVPVGSTGLLGILQHSLGVDKYGRGNQYRNRYVTDAHTPDGKRCEELVERGLMENRGSLGELSGGMNCYTVTPKGVDVVALQSPAPPKISRGKERYQRYLRSECSETFGEWLKMASA